jgi:hypothetical protein
MDDDWKPTFLKVLAEGSSVEMACRAAGTTRHTATKQRKADKEFADQWDQAMEAGTDILEQVAMHRAKDYSDQMLMFLLKARRPAIYGDRQRLEHVRIDYTDAQQELEVMARKILDEDEPEVKQIVDHRKS